MNAKRYLGVIVTAGFLLAGPAAVTTAVTTAAAATETCSHGLSFFGELKYGPDFSHFDYVNRHAPKGGTLSHVGSEAAFNAAFLSYDTLNGYILKGDAAQGLHLIFDTLLERAYDEPSSLYGRIARCVWLPEHGNRVVFELRETARFHDGTPLTAQDVAFSLELLKEKGHPLIAGNLREMVSATALEEYKLEVTFSGKQAPDLALFVSQLPIFSKAYYTQHEFGQTTLEPPLGSGPYRIADFRPGRFIAYKRVEDYWGAELPVMIGRYNFDTIRFEYFRDRTVQFEAFTAGTYRLREEFTSRVWAKDYDFPAMLSGDVIRMELPDERPSGAQGWFINLRRGKFQDLRVREALIYAFDFEWTNKNQFYGAYQRTHSFFQNSEMMATGLPSEAELALLEPYRGSLPAEVYGVPFSPPVSDGSGQDRGLLRHAKELLSQAGWTVRDGVLKNRAGEVFKLEILINAPTFERIIAPYIANLKRLGFEAKLRMVDSAQYQRRLTQFDFDMTTRRYTVPVIPGVAVRSYWGSAFADQPGSYNLSGIKDPVVDALIDKLISASNRAAQVIAAKALDRVLRAGRYWVPQWYNLSYRMAFWNEFAWPETKPRYARGVLDTWWATAPDP